MVGFRWSGSSREGLVLVVRLVGAIAVVNCNTFVFNQSGFWAQIYDAATSEYVSAIAPGARFQQVWQTAASLPESHLFFFDLYEVTPNVTSGSPAVSGDKFSYASFYVSDNATITFFPTAGGRMGSKVEYNVNGPSTVTSTASIAGSKIPDVEPSKIPYSRLDYRKLISPSV